MDLFDLAADYAAARAEKDQLEDKKKEVQAVMDALEVQMTAYMVENGLQNFNYQKHIFSLSVKTFASLPADKKEGFFRKMRRRGFGTIIKPTVSPQTLTAWVKEEMGKNGDALPTWMEGWVEVYQKPAISLRKTK